MQILIICNYASGLYKFRGMLIRELHARGNQISAVVPQSGEEQELLAERQIEKIGCPLVHTSMERRGMNPLKDMKLFFSYRRLLKEYCPDYVITYTIKPNIYGGMACRLARIPYAVNITGLGTAFQNEGMLRNLVSLMYKVSLKEAKVVFFENVENRDIFVSLGIIKQDKTHVLAGAGVDLEHFSYMEYPMDTEETRFLFIGRVMKEKGIEELFAAMQMLRSDGLNCVLHILGGFEEDYSQRLKQYEAEGWLCYHGYQSDVRPFIANCHCFVLPSWHEGMANTNLECAAMGRPVITSNIHGCVEAVVDGESGLLCKKMCADDLYCVMKKFVRLSDAQKIEMGRRGRKHMEKFFEKKAVVEETMRVGGLL